MYQSNPLGMHIPSPFGSASSSVVAGSNLLNDSCSTVSYFFILDIILDIVIRFQVQLLWCSP